MRSVAISWRKRSRVVSAYLLDCRCLRLKVQFVITRPELRQNGDFVARDRAEGFAEIDVGPVKIRHVKEGNAPFVRVLQQGDELLESHARVIGLAIAAAHPRALADARQRDSRLAQRNLRRRRRRGQVLGTGRLGRRCQVRCRTCGCCQEVPATHFGHIALSNVMENPSP